MRGRVDAMREVEQRRDARVERLERADVVAGVHVLRLVARGDRLPDSAEVLGQRPVRAERAHRATATCAGGCRRSPAGPRARRRRARRRHPSRCRARPPRSCRPRSARRPRRALRSWGPWTARGRRATALAPSFRQDRDHARGRGAGADDPQREAGDREPARRQRAEVAQALDLRVGQVGLVGRPEDARLAALAGLARPAGAAARPSPRRRSPSRARRGRTASASPRR